MKEARDAESDAKLSVVRLFAEIWGVGDATANEFYRKGYRDLDDVVEYEWGALSRVQQIGVKYFDEFLIKIPRAEVEAIGNVILAHAAKLRPGYQMVIVGGYRRGKEQSGDVDVILSHPEADATDDFVGRIIVSLEKAKYITHTLTLSTKNSERGQAPVSWKGNEKRAGSGFDTLDKALVVWQDPQWAPAAGVVEDTNPNPHRRVDIIISPWKTVGCAVLGWTSGTTFQRDLRRYCKKERSLKFDSSGVRSRVDGISPFLFCFLPIPRLARSFLRSPSSSLPNRESRYPGLVRCRSSPGYTRRIRTVADPGPWESRVVGRPRGWRSGTATRHVDGGAACLFWVRFGMEGPRRAEHVVTGGLRDDERVCLDYCL